MIRRLFLLSLSPLLLAAEATAQSVNTLPAMRTITFAPGSNSSTVAGQLAPGGRNVYYVQAKAGQTLMVSVMPAVSGATFQVFNSDAALAKGTDGMAVVTGRTLPDAGPNDKATAWIGAIPRDGNYLVLVTMGGAAGAPANSYNLTVSLQ